MGVHQSSRGTTLQVTLYMTRRFVSSYVLKCLHSRMISGRYKSCDDVLWVLSNRLDSPRTSIHHPRHDHQRTVDALDMQGDLEYLDKYVQSTRKEVLHTKVVIPASKNLFGG